MPSGSGCGKPYGTTARTSSRSGRWTRTSAATRRRSSPPSGPLAGRLLRADAGRLPGEVIHRPRHEASEHRAGVIRGGRALGIVQEAHGELDYEETARLVLFTKVLGECRSWRFFRPKHRER